MSDGKRRDPRGGHPAGVAALPKAREASPPGEAALTHQGYRLLHRGLFPVCARCAVRCADYQEEGTCRPGAEAVAQVERDLRALPGILPQDAGLCAEYARLLVLRDVIDLHTANAAGVFLPGADKGYIEAQPIMDLRLRLSARLQALANDLGLSPAARSRLRTDPDRGPGARIADVFRQLEDEDRAEREKAQALDAEFTTADQDGPQGAQADGAGVDAPEDAEDAHAPAMAAGEDGSTEATG